MYSCIGEIKPIGKFTRIYQFDLYRISIFLKQQIVKKNSKICHLCVQAILLNLIERCI